MVRHWMCCEGGKTYCAGGAADMAGTDVRYKQRLLAERKQQVRARRKRDKDKSRMSKRRWRTESDSKET